jgi:hypothetical protein
MAEVAFTMLHCKSSVMSLMSTGNALLRASQLVFRSSWRFCFANAAHALKFIRFDANFKYTLTIQGAVVMGLLDCSSIFQVGDT